jgi:hypothetical protein
VTSSTCFPSTPPDLFTRSSAIFAPLNEYLPLSAAGPVTGSTMPILIVESSARARRRIAGAKLAASPQFTVRLVSFMPSSRFFRHPRFQTGAFSSGKVTCAGALGKPKASARAGRIAAAPSPFFTGRGRGWGSPWRRWKLSERM